MATTSTPNNPSTNDNSSATSSTFTSESYFQNTVCLNDWWLVKADKDFQGKQLAVAGVPHREQKALRVFSSAPILKRHDLFNLETADGVWIIVKGLINKARTEENGFPSEVFEHFICGFPPYWEKYAVDYFGGEPTTVGAGQSNLDSEKLSPEEGTVDCSNPCKNKDMGSEDAVHDNGRKDSSIKDSPAEGKKDSTIEDSPVGGKKESRSNLKGGQAKPSVDVLEQKSGAVTKFSITDSPVSDNLELSPMAAEASAKELPPRDSSIKHMEIVEPFGNNLDDNVTQPPQSECEKNSVPPSYPDTMSIDEDGRRDKTKKLLRKAASKVMHSPSGLRGVENKREKNVGVRKRHIFQPASFSAKKETLVTPKKKEEPSIASPECLSLGRSRSGRLLLPTMQFWRNQRVVYDADRRIMGINDPQLNQPTKGSRSEPQRKKRPLR